VRVGLELRFQVPERAARRCEYCLIHEHDAAFGHEVDHVISRQHGGLAESDNLAFACLFCNRIKGTNLASINPAGGALVRLFNPRRDRWHDHFRLEAPVIQPLSPEGVVTARLLEFSPTFAVEPSFGLNSDGSTR
jgi:hypothetical protein